jgi:hypothetical protein
LASIVSTPEVAVGGANYAPCNSELLYGLFPYFGKGFFGISGLESEASAPLSTHHFDQPVLRLDAADRVLSTLQTLGEVD